jgi:hypothetical protein
MKTSLVVLLALSLCVLSFAFVVETPESRKAEAAWDREIRSDFDLSALHDFLLRTLATHQRFEDIDLASSATGREWMVDLFHRRLLSKRWWFQRNEKAQGFQFRYYPGQGDREVVLECEREGREQFRFVKARWGQITLDLAHKRRPDPKGAKSMCLIVAGSIATHRESSTTNVLNLAPIQPGPQSSTPSSGRRRHLPPVVLTPGPHQVCCRGSPATIVIDESTARFLRALACSISVCIGG